MKMRTSRTSSGWVPKKALQSWLHVGNSYGLAVGRQTDQNSLDVANSMFYFVHTLHKYYIILFPHVHLQLC